MEDLEGQVIDEEFRSQLQSANSQKILEVIITIKETPKVTKLIGNDGEKYREKSSEELRKVKEAEEEMMEPVSQYLDKLKINYYSHIDEHIVLAEMLPGQVLELEKQPYVDIICPNKI